MVIFSTNQPQTNSSSIGFGHQGGGHSPLFLVHVSSSRGEGEEPNSTLSLVKEAKSLHEYFIQLNIKEAKIIMIIIYLKLKFNIIHSVIKNRGQYPTIKLN